AGRESIARNLRRGLRPGGLLLQGESPLIDTPGDGFEIIPDSPGILRRTAWPNGKAPASGFAALFITRELQVRWITPSLARLFELGPADLKQPVEALAQRLDDPDLPGDTRAVLDGQEPICRQVRGPHARWLFRRMRPAGTGGKASNGVVA